MHLSGPNDTANASRFPSMLADTLAKVSIQADCCNSIVFNAVSCRGCDVAVPTPYGASS